jgi:hypothetical protein
VADKRVNTVLKKTNTALKAFWIIFSSTGILLFAIINTSWIEAYLAINWGLLLLDTVLLVGVVSIGTGLLGAYPRVMGLGIASIIRKLQKKPRPVDYKGIPLPEGGNVSLVGTEIKYIGVIVSLLMMTALPYLAYFEELLFRQGTVNWRDGILRSIAFGFSHMLVGVPLGPAIAITAAGLFFTQVYFVGGIATCTQAHFQYNIILFSVLLFETVRDSFTMKQVK